MKGDNDLRRHPLSRTQMKAPRCQTRSCKRQKIRRRVTKIQRKAFNRRTIPLSTLLLNQMMLEMNQRVNDQQMRLKIQKDKFMQQWRFNQWNGADRRVSDCYLKLMELELNQKERDLNQCKTKMQVDTVKFLDTLVSMVDGLAKGNNMNPAKAEADYLLWCFWIICCSRHALPNLLQGFGTVSIRGNWTII